MNDQTNEACRGTGRKGKQGSAMQALGFAECPVCKQSIDVDSDGLCVPHAPLVPDNVIAIEDGKLTAKAKLKITKYSCDQLRTQQAELTETILNLYEASELPGIKDMSAPEVAAALLAGFRHCHRCRSNDPHRRGEYGLCRECLVSLDEHVAMRKTAPKWYGLKSELLDQALKDLLKAETLAQRAITPGEDGARQAYETHERCIVNLREMRDQLNKAHATKTDLIIRGGLT